MSPDPSLTGLLGRYECTTEGHSKFWELRFNKGTGMYEARWGKIGTAGQGPTSYSGVEARKKIQEKISKGYVNCGYDTAIENERNEITRDVKDAVKNQREKFNFLKELKKV